VTPLDNAILDRWAAGESGGSIRRAFGLDRNHVTNTVCAARNRNDPRAVIHTRPDGIPVGRFAHRAPASLRL